MAKPAMELKLVSLDKTYGSVPFDTLMRMATEGRLVVADLVRRPGAAQWTPVGEVPALAAALPQQTDAAGDDTGGDAWTMRLPRQEEDTEMDMTPMIDVTFQLLIFFMLTNALANPVPIATPEALHGRGVTIEGQQLILIDEAGAYYLGDEVAPANAVASLDALVAEVGDNARKAELPMDVIVNAHGQTKHRPVRELVERLGGIPGLGKVMIGVEEKRDW